MAKQSGIWFSDGQFKWLKARAKKLEVSLAEVVRRIVDEKREALKSGAHEL